MRQDYTKLNKQFSFLILDYERPDESRSCLNSIKDNVKFENYEVVFYSNGGEQDYVYDFYKEGLIDRCILRSKNEGTGFGTMKLVQSCATDYFMSVQCDNYINREFEQEELDEMIQCLKGGETKCIDLVYVASNEFSERCYVMETDFYNANPYQRGGGPGPYIELSWTEQTTQQWIAENGGIKHWRLQEILDQLRKENGNAAKIPLIGNSGKYTVRECKLGGKYKFRNDTQQLWILSPPSGESYFGKVISGPEWSLILNGEWVDGKIPEGQKRWAHNVWGSETEKNENGEWQW